MDIQQAAVSFVKGDFVECNGLGMHDAVHVIATTYGFNKADLRSAIYSAYAADVPEVEEVAADEEE